MYQESSTEVPNIQFYEDPLPGSGVTKSNGQLCTQAERHTGLQAKAERRRISAIYPYELAIKHGRRKQTRNIVEQKYYVEDTKPTSRTNGQFSLNFM
jgi:hypothetical protein